MFNKKFFISLAALSLLVTACGGKGGDKTSDKPAGDSTSGQPQQSTTSNNPATSTSQAPVHVHDYQAAGAAVKNADGKDVSLMECKDHDSRYIAIAFKDYSSTDLGFKTDLSEYTNVSEEVRNQTMMMEKKCTVSWKINLDKAITGAKLAFAAVSTNPDQTEKTLSDRHSTKVNDGELTPWGVGSMTYGEAGLNQTSLTYIEAQTIDLVEGENTISLYQGNGGYRLLFGGEVRIYYNSDAAPVEAPVEGHKVTFVPSAHVHVSVLTGLDADGKEVWEEKLKDDSRDEDNVDNPYIPATYVAPVEDDPATADVDESVKEVKPSTNFKLTFDDGYTADGNDISISGTMGQEWNKLSSEGANWFSVSKIKDDITITITERAVTGTEKEGYAATFNLEHCSVKVYLGKKNKAGDNLDTIEDGKYYSRDKDTGALSKAKAQFNFEVVPEEGYEFDSGLALNGESSPIGISFVTGSYGNFKRDKSNGDLYSITKVATDLVINLTATRNIAQPTGTFFASAQITDAGKTALGTTNGSVPIFITLGENSASVSVNGQSAGECSIKQYDKTNGWLVITTQAFGDLSMQYNPDTKDLEKLSVKANTGILQWDGGQALKGNEKLKYWNCDGTTEELQAQWNRRYGDPWTLDTNNADRVTKNTDHAISGSAMRLRPYADNRFALAAKDFAEKFNARNISFWVYNSGTADATIQCFAYKSTGYSNYVQPFTNKTIPAGQWTYITAGFTAVDLYSFQIFVAKTASALIFDDICLF